MTCLSSSHEARVRGFANGFEFIRGFAAVNWMQPQRPQARTDCITCKSTCELELELDVPIFY
ncbi:hypothetical protein A6V36_16975 [Paraburkholderia ginsengiterrae]|uniref:Uncharacterized protein n=1 Tax=Paraburkholderia ginsengiterrae TaxID=1462993 RepID=A0A1A9MZV2_9BURK|nr:hypothetical protein A6V37_34640 [Paraburkholderia ginsengiterrae]OAJ63714.1 hypothetical protein A6V36_16975 [Paraburkholderia ginsengiterrae]